MLLSAVSLLVVAQSSSELAEGLVNNPVFFLVTTRSDLLLKIKFFKRQTRGAKSIYKQQKVKERSVITLFNIQFIKQSKQAEGMKHKYVYSVGAPIFLFPRDN